MPMNQVIFESISEIPAWIEAHPIAVRRPDSDMRGSRDWDAGLGYAGAVKMAAEGGYWEAGAAKMLEATTKAAELKRDDVVREIDEDVVGTVLDMDAYLSGNPECWLTEDSEVPAPVIRIGVQQYTPGGNDQQSFINRGAAILSVIDDLEAQGIRVELWGCLSGKHRHNRDELEGIDMRTCLKSSDSVWSPSSVAFGLCHAAFGRRLGFRVVESFKDLQKYVDNGHGLDFDHDRPVDSDFDIWIGYRDMITGRGQYRDMKKALERVTAEIERQLTEGKDYAKM